MEEVWEVPSLLSLAWLGMAHYTNIVSIVHPWSLGCGFMPLKYSLNYFLYEIPEKKTTTCNNNFPLKS